MYKNGKKINKNRKYTYDEMRKVATETASRSMIEIVDMVLNVAAMAYIDTPPNDPKAFVSLLTKYCQDFKEGEFSKTALNEYITDQARELAQKL